MTRAWGLVILLALPVPVLIKTGIIIRQPLARLSG